MGPFLVVSKTGFRYSTFIDDHSPITWLYFMKNRYELLAHFCNFRVEIRTQFGLCLETLRSDNSGEYFSEALNFFSYPQVSTPAYDLHPPRLIS